MADTRATGTAGAPSRNAGNRKATRTAKATTMPIRARNPRHRATATITTANAAASAISGQPRS